jgi:hypothetical protein
MTNIERLIEALQPEVDAMRTDLVGMRQQVASDDAISAFFVERLELAVETVIGCIVLAKGDLAYPVAILARSVLELAMVTFWAASNSDRANEASGASTAEVTRVMKNLLSKGH